MKIRLAAALGAGLFLAVSAQALPISLRDSVPDSGLVNKVAFSLPRGAPCTTRYDRYQSVVEADHRTGNVNEPVYAEIERELSHAAAACAAGRDGEALSLIHQSEVRHGYHP